MSQRIQMIPIKTICSVCGGWTNVIDILDKKQYNRSLKIDELLF